MTKDVLLILDECGWYDGRKIDVSYMIEDLAREGFTVPNDLILGLLEQYWNLELNFTTPDGKFGSIRLNIDAAIDGSSPIAMKKYSEISHEEIVPVGTIFFDNALFLMAYSGRCYMAYENNFWLIGDDFDKALFTIIHQDELISLI